MRTKSPEDFLAAISLPTRHRPAPRPPRLPFEPLPAIPEATRQALVAAVAEVNDRYLETFLEPNSFCPFSRGGRQRGQTLRLVHYADSPTLEPFYALMAEAARDPSRLVIQVVVPLVEVSPDDWTRFCHDLTAAGNERLRGDGEEIFAVAPLHPELRYSAVNPFALIPLLRRTPDPTIQWVRLDALDKLYEGRTGDTVYADPDDLASFFARPRRSPLFDRIAETNFQMAQRLGIVEVERQLRALSRAGRDRYSRILLADEALQEAPVRSGRPRAPASDVTPPTPALLERDGRFALVRADELVPGIPRRFLADQVELAAIRVADQIFVLHGRCPHRNAPLSDALVEGERLVCPHHGWDFHLGSGRSEGVPGAAVARFRSWVEEGLLWVDGEELRTWRRTHVEVFQAHDDVL